jgi:hypothetical protein
VTGAPSGAAKRLDVSLIRQGGEFIDVTGGDGGTMRSRPSKPGPYELRLTLKIGEWSNLVVAKRAVDLASGENALEIAVPPLYPLDLDLGADESGTCFLHHVTDDDDTEFVNVELDADGRAKFDLVPAGRYRVQAGGKDHEFRVPETRTFKLP